MANQNLINQVINQIQKDIDKGDVTAIELLLENIPEEHLVAYLPEEHLVA